MPEPLAAAAASASSLAYIVSKRTERRPNRVSQLTHHHIFLFGSKRIRTDRNPPCAWLSELLHRCMNTHVSQTLPSKTKTGGDDTRFLPFSQASCALFRFLLPSSRFLLGFRSILFTLVPAYVPGPSRSASIRNERWMAGMRTGHLLDL